MSSDQFSVLWEMPIVCTDKGGHKRIRLTTAQAIKREDGTTSRHMSHALRHFAPPNADAESGGAVSRTSYTFICPICRRNPIVERARWWEAVESAQRVGITEIDLSQVGF